MDKTIKLNAKNIISINKNLDMEITKNCHIIRNENVMSNKAIKAGLGSNKDLKALFNYTQQLREKRIMIKGIKQYLNMGIETFDYEKFKKTNYYAIFAACEAKETIAQLKMIPTINPSIKAKKGKKNIGKTESFSSAKIAQLIHDQQLLANKYDAMLEKFNNETMIDVSSKSDEFESYLIV